LEIDEVAARLIRRYWLVFLLCITAPLIVVGLITVKQPPMYSADARIITGSLVPSSSTQSDAIVSQVEAIATGRATATAALKTAGANRNISQFVKDNISVSGLGGSQVVDLVVTDKSPEVAQKVARALATAATDSLNHVGQSGLESALKAIDDQIVKLSQQRATLAQQVSRTPRNQQLQAKLAGLDEVIANFTGDRGRILIQASTQGLAGVIDAPSRPVHPVPSALPQKLGLAALLGVVAAILIASIAEVVRPTLPGAQRVARRLGAPLLGRLVPADLRGVRTPGIAKLALRVRLAAMHAAVSTVVLADVGTVAGLDKLAGALEDAVGPLAPESSNGVGAAAASNSHDPVAEQPGSAEAATLVVNRRFTLPQPRMRFFPLSRMTATGEIGWHRVGVLVVCGPVARVADVAALTDLAESSGWPILGVVGVPHAGRKLRKRVAGDNLPTAVPIAQADAARSGEGSGA
jgi:capsular polysaccharide biosynthesis protein